jgi:tetratricopeptide (TPR) repeat protein
LPEAVQYGWTAFLGLGQAARQILVPVPGGASTYIEGDSAGPFVVAALAWLAVAAVLVWTAVRTRAWRLPAVGVLLALALLLPSLLSADRYGHALRFPTRYFHLPLAGVLIAALPYAVRSWSRILRFAAPVLVALLVLLSWMRIGEWRDSVSFFYSETIYHPNSPPDLLNLVRAMTNARAYNEAEKVLDRAEQLGVAQDPSIRAKLLNDRAAITLLRDGDIERASRYLQLALSIDPTDLANVLDLAAARATAGRYDQAVIVLQKALDSPWFRDYRRTAIEDRLVRYRDLALESNAASGGSHDQR